MRLPTLFRCLAGCLLIQIIGAGVYGQIELTRIDGRKSNVQQFAINAGQLETADGKTDLNEFRLIDMHRPISESRSGIDVSIVGGGRVDARSVALDDETFVIQNVAGEIRLGVDAVTRIRFRKEPLPLFENARPKEDLDQLFVRIRGAYQTVPGIVDSMTENGVSILYEEDVIDFKIDDVYGLILAQDLEREKADVNAVLFLTEGSRISCLLENANAEKIEAMIGDVARIEVPLSVVSRIEIRSSRLVFLSDLEPVSAKNMGGGVIVRKWQKDRNINGKPLTLKDPVTRKARTYEKGLGTKSGMSLVFENEDFDRFVATVGIDASTRGNGDCRVRILADGEVLAEQDLKGTDPPRLIDLEITGRKNIELEIGFGRDFLDLSDHVDWCDARFVKASR